jgi:DNA repair protein RecO (recombination protein O)
LQQSPTEEILPCFLYAFMQLLSLGGVAPQVDRCCITGERLRPDVTDPNWRSGFSVASGGVVTLAALEKLRQKSKPVPVRSQPHPLPTTVGETVSGVVAESRPRQPTYSPRSPHLNQELAATELVLLQMLTQALPSHPTETATFTLDYAQLAGFNELWFSIERLLRQYAQYHFDRPIRSAALMDACFSSPTVSCQPPEP